MPKGPPATVKKPFVFRLWELAESLRVVRDALHAMRSGKSHQVRALASQLRVLLTDRSKGVKPLLVDVAQQMNNPLTVFHNRGVRSAEEAAAAGPDPVLFIMSGFPITVHRALEEQLESNLTSLLWLNMVRFNGRSYTPSDLIAFFANTAGGAHSPTHWPRDLAALMSTMQLGGAPTPITILAQIGDAVIKVGVSLLREIGCVDLYCGLVIPRQTLTKDATLLCLDYSPLPANICVTLTADKRIIVRVSSMHGLTSTVVAETFVDWSRAHYLGLSQWITDDLETETVVQIDGIGVGRSRADMLSLLPAEHAPFLVYMNRAPNDPNSACVMGVFAVYFSPAFRPLHDQAEHILSLYNSATDPASKCVLLQPGQFAYSDSSCALQFPNGGSPATIQEILAESHPTVP